MFSAEKDLLKAYSLLGIGGNCILPAAIPQARVEQAFSLYIVFLVND